MSASSRLIQTQTLLTKTGWATDTVIEVAAAGHIIALHDGVPDGRSVDERIEGPLIPGLTNAHSHAFQFAMAGLAEHLPEGASSDDFWSWREAMYRLALAITPEAMEAIATTLYAEMLRHGYTRVAEFHYLHHAPDGKPYANPAEMSLRLAAAAKRAGIGLTLLPVFYQRGGFGRDAQPQQRRFLSRSRDEYLKLRDAIASALKDHAQVGAAVHSLRAVAEEDTIAVLSDDSLGPRHIHIAEQTQEVVDCLTTLGQRPVAWLLDHVALGPEHALVHATHMTSEEATRLAHTGAVAVICPSTEGNLGDGLFSLDEYRGAGGAWAIGSDSHVTVSTTEELRWLDYGQRLRALKRNIVCRSGGEDSGRLLFGEAWHGGEASVAAAAGQSYFALGQAFDALEIDPRHPSIAGKPAARLLSGYVYAGGADAIRRVWRQGHVVVQDGRHIVQDAAREASARAIQTLLRGS